jgi:hypothetical protein
MRRREFSKPAHCELVGEVEALPPNKRSRRHCRAGATCASERREAMGQTRRAARQLTAGSGAAAGGVSLVTMSERDGPLVQERPYKHHSGQRRRTSGKPRTFLLHVRRPYTVAERGRCIHCETGAPQRTWLASIGMKMRHRGCAPSCRPGGCHFPVEHLGTAS